MSFEGHPDKELAGLEWPDTCQSLPAECGGGNIKDIAARLGVRFPRETDQRTFEEGGQGLAADSETSRRTGREDT
jgi:hypothetical protein